jgi:hypothetical protein
MEAASGPGRKRKQQISVPRSRWVPGNPLEACIGVLLTTEYPTRGHNNLELRLEDLSINREKLLVVVGQESSTPDQGHFNRGDSKGI